MKFWIRSISFDDATHKLKDLYRRIAGPNNAIDNILEAHSLRPHTLSGHLALYKSVLHHRDNQIPKWFLETLGVYVSHLNACNYCFVHHKRGLRRLLRDDERHQNICDALTSGHFDAAIQSGAFEHRHRIALNYAKKLTVTPNQVRADAIKELRQAGFEDGEILEINQVVSYFAYANRTVLGLGVHSEGDVLGLSPGDEDEDNWAHS